MTLDIRGYFFALDSEGCVYKFGMLQYMFDSPEVDTNVKPHVAECMHAVICCVW